MICDYCKKEIEYKRRKTHLRDCDAYMEYLDEKDSQARKAEQDASDARMNILCHEFTEEQAMAIIALIEHMERER